MYLSDAYAHGHITVSLMRAGCGQGGPEEPRSLVAGENKQASPQLSDTSTRTPRTRTQRESHTRARGHRT